MVSNFMIYDLRKASGVVNTKCFSCAGLSKKSTTAWYVYFLQVN
jgi:hypothetical protein